MSDYQVAVLGVGAVGSAALYHLAQRGVSAVGVERFQPGHDRGSSHGDTRVIRKAYFEAPEYVPLLHRAYEGWARLEEESGESLFLKTGLVEIGPPDGYVVPGVLRAAKEHALDVEPLSAGALTERYKGLLVPEGMSGVYEADGGLLHVEACVAAHARLAEEAGATLLTGTSVARIERDGAGVALYTSAGVIRADALIVSAGAWAHKLLPELALPLKVKRKVLLWYPLQGDAAYQNRSDEGGVVFLYEFPEGVYYGFPSLDGRSLKVACHDDGGYLEAPLTLDRSLYPEDHAGVDAFLRAYMPGVMPGCPIRHAVCMYTMTPDLHMIVDRVPHLANAWFAAGLSGHGFKYSNALGEALVERVMGEPGHVDLRPFATSRFLST